MECLLCVHGTWLTLCSILHLVVVSLAWRLLLMTLTPSWGFPVCQYQVLSLSSPGGLSSPASSAPTWKGKKCSVKFSNWEHQQWMNSSLVTIQMVCWVPVYNKRRIKDMRRIFILSYGHNGFGRILVEIWWDKIRIFTMHFKVRTEHSFYVSKCNIFTMQGTNGLSTWKIML